MPVSAGTVFVNVVPQTAGFGTALGSQLTKVGRGVSAVGRKLTTGLTLPLVGAGVVATKMALDFDSAFAKIQALGGDTGASLDEMKQKVLDLAGTTAQAPQDLAEALYFVSSAGLKASSVFPVLKASAEGAAAGMSDAQTMAQTLTSVMNAYEGTGLTAAKAMNIFTAAVQAGKAEPEDWAEGLGAVVPAAAQAGVQLQDLASGIATATDLGVSADRAFTGFRFLLQSLVSPTDQAKETLDKYGLTVEGLSKRLQEPGGLTNTLQFLADRFDITSVKGKAAWQDITGGARGAIVANTLVGRSAELATRNQEALSEAAKKTADTFDIALGKVKETDAFRFQQALTDLKVAMIELGATLLPILTDQIIPAIQGVAEWWTKLGESGQKTAVQIGILVAALGPGLGLIGSLLRIGGSVATAIGWLTRLGSTATATAAATTAASGQMTLPGLAAPAAAGVGIGAGAATAAVIGLAAAVGYLAVQFIDAKFEGAALFDGLQSGAVSTTEAMEQIAGHSEDVAGGLFDVSKQESLATQTTKGLGHALVTGLLGPTGALVGFLDASGEGFHFLSTNNALEDYADDFNNLVAPIIAAKDAEHLFTQALFEMPGATLEQKAAIGRSIEDIYRFTNGLTDSSEQLLLSTLRTGTFAEVMELIGPAAKEAAFGVSRIPLQAFAADVIYTSKLTDQQSTSLSLLADRLTKLGVEMSQKQRAKFELLVDEGKFKQASRLLQDLIDKARGLDREKPSVKPEVDNRAANHGVEALQARLRRLESGRKPIDIDLDTDKAFAKISVAQQRISSLRSKVLREPIRLDADTKSADTKINRTKQAGQDLGKLKLEPTVGINDQASGPIRNIHTDLMNIKALSPIGITVNVDYNAGNPPPGVPGGREGMIAGVPAMGRGGYVTSGPTLAVIGEAGPEAVVPLTRKGMFHGSKPPGLSVDMGPQEIVGELTLTPDGRAFVRGVLVEEQRFAERKGRAHR